MESNQYYSEQERTDGEKSDEQKNSTEPKKSDENILRQIEETSFESWYHHLKNYLNFLPSNTSSGRFLDYYDSVSNRWKYDDRITLPDTFSIQDPTLENRLALADEINNLKKKLTKVVGELNDTKADRENKIAEFEKLAADLTAKEKINHILSRISENGREKLLESDAFRQFFNNFNKCDAVVVSIDIRRSTEMMLKARTPELFSKFITELSFKLSQTIISNYGIFDKFTGDGILAFFPKFYSGDEAIIRAIKASNECHHLFNEHYNNSKHCFNLFIKDVGLGIGIDFGNVTLVNTERELTVVGIPVVYACRFSGVEAGETLINQPAMEEIRRLCQTMVSFKEKEINIKNEGVAIGYKVSLNEAAYKLEKPNWDELITKFNPNEVLNK